MHIYRSHTCGVLRKKDQGKTVRLSGWVFRKRDHGGLVFIDLRDYSGLIQLIGSPEMLSSISLESVICVTGIVRARSLETINKDLLTGEVEIHVDVVNVLSHASSLPISIHDDSSSPEDMRLQYRYLDLRRPDMYNRMILRTKIIDYLRNSMREKGFVELQTPILTASSPEGARDFLVPSRLHVGKFYALPQAPQIFKQLLMVAGFDRYFQIAPCFRDEDSRADRSPGEFYQLDIEMSFVTQDDVLSTVEPVLYEIFSIFSSKKVTPYPFPRITYNEAMKIYGSDKPDLRNPLRIVDVTNVFSNSSFRLFSSLIEQGAVVRAIRVKNLALQPRKMFHDLAEWALDHGQSGLGYIMLKDNLYAGPLSKHLDENRIMQLVDCLDLHETDGAFFICGLEKHIEKFSGLLRTKLAEYLELINDDSFHFLWVVDFPMYTRDVNTGVINFFHNPFSMPQGGMDSLLQKDPLDILAYQYDIVCNGVELSSGAIRNHLPEIMYKAFEIAGYSNQYVNQTFSSMIKAFQFGAPPHGGCAPGIDRMIMLLLGVKNLREVILFPMNQMGEDLMMRAPSTVSELQLRELGLKYL